jgi:hypothetical protein
MVPTDLIVNTSVQHAITRLVKDLMEIVQVDVIKTTRDISANCQVNK